jgi:hypothetical protein
MGLHGPLQETALLFTFPNEESGCGVLVLYVCMYVCMYVCIYVYSRGGPQTAPAPRPVLVLSLHKFLRHSTHRHL